jgi:hypothetical protein
MQATNHTLRYKHDSTMIANENDEQRKDKNK